MRELLGRAHLRPTKIDLLSKQRARYTRSMYGAATLLPGWVLSRWESVCLLMSVYLSVSLSICPFVSVFLARAHIPPSLPPSLPPSPHIVRLFSLPSSLLPFISPSCTSLHLFFHAFPPLSLLPSFPPTFSVRVSTWELLWSRGTFTPTVIPREIQWARLHNTRADTTLLP